VAFRAGKKRGRGRSSGALYSGGCHGEGGRV
jgi:hypothetical protein